MKTKCHSKRGLYSLCVVILLADMLLAFGGNVAARPWISFAIFAAAIFAIYKLISAKDAPRRLLTPTLIIAVGVALRFCFMAYPLSDDVNRYAWEGMIQYRGVNPYVTAPANLADEFGDDQIFLGINHKDVPTAYPPAALLIFKMISGIWYSLLAYKIFFILIDCAVLFLLSRLLSLLRQPSSLLIVYAWNPLILLNGAGEGHFDVLHILFLVAAFVFFALWEKKESGYYARIAFILLGTAVMTKFLSLIFLPFLIKRDNAKAAPYFLIPFLAYIPFWKPGIFQGLMTFSGKMSYNDVIPRLLRIFLDGRLYMVAILAVFTCGLILIWLFTQSHTNNLASTAKPMCYAYIWCLLCLPCVHIWYLTPLVLLLALYPARSGFLLSATIALGFHVMSRQYYNGEWIESRMFWALTWGPPILLLIHDWLKKSALPATSYPPIDSVDVVIPVHNEGERIERHLSTLTVALKEAENTGIRFNVIVVDADSSDDTAEIAERFNARVIQAPKKGRGSQIAEGFNLGSGDVVLTLHADAEIHADALTSLIREFRGSDKLAWGILGHAYDRPSLRMTKVRMMNRFRFHVLGIAFGDQGIFFRRETMMTCEGLPRIKLMEDVEISERLADAPRRNLGEHLTISTRRWDNRTLFSYSAQVIWFVSLYLGARRLGFDIKRLSDKLYDWYYVGASR